MSSDASPDSSASPRRRHTDRAPDARDAALKDSVAFYYSLVESLPQNILRKDLDGRFTFANSRACRTMGVDLDALLGKTDFDVFPAALAARYRADDLHVIRTGETLEGTEAHEGAAGQMFVQIIKAPVRDARGLVSGVQVIFWDVTERTRMEERLHYEKDRYRLLFDRSLAGVYQSTLDGRLLDCNDAFARILGYASREACLAGRATDCYETPAEREPFLSRLLEQKTLADFENRLRRSDGTAIWVIEGATLIEAQPGRAAFIEGTLIDISRRKEMEEQLAQKTVELTANVQRYRQLVESTNAVPWEMDGDTLTLRYISPQATRLFGFDTAQMVGAGTIWDLIHVDDRERVLGQFRELAVQPDHSALDTNYRIMSGRGQVMHVRMLVTVQHSTDGTVLLRGITLDVTEQHKLERDLQQAQKLESVGRLAAGVAHEINTPVQFVSDSIQFVRDAIGDLDHLLAGYQALPTDDAASTEAARTALADIEARIDLPYLREQIPKALERSLEGLERVTTIVRSMKEFAYPDQRRMSAVDLNRAIASTIVIARNEYKYVADMETEFGTLPPVTCHVGDVNQAVLNIIVNAAHAIGDVVHRSGQRGRIVVRTWCEDDQAIISIRDTGDGIPETIRDQVFEPFFTTKEVGRGTGQGLAIARAVMVEKHRGSLTFETETGVGTTFFLKLPIDGAGRRGVAA